MLDSDMKLCTYFSKKKDFGRQQNTDMIKFLVDYALTCNDVETTKVSLISQQILNF